jgi:hypothetical protein
MFECLDRSSAFLLRSHTNNIRDRGRSKVLVLIRILE